MSGLKILMTTEFSLLFGRMNISNNQHLHIEYSTTDPPKFCERGITFSCDFDSSAKHCIHLIYSIRKTFKVG